MKMCERHTGECEAGLRDVIKGSLVSVQKREMAAEVFRVAILYVAFN